MINTFAADATTRTHLQFLSSFIHAEETQEEIRINCMFLCGCKCRGLRASTGRRHCFIRGAGLIRSCILLFSTPLFSALVFSALPFSTYPSVFCFLYLFFFALLHPPLPFSSLLFFTPPSSTMLFVYSSFFCSSLPYSFSLCSSRPAPH